MGHGYCLSNAKSNLVHQVVVEGFWPQLNVLKVVSYSLCEVLPLAIRPESLQFDVELWVNSSFLVISCLGLIIPELPKLASPHALTERASA